MLALAAAAPGAAQQWNSARALELVGRARERRAAPYRDSALVSYRADARGFIYFYLDRDETSERTLVKTDQVALEVYWQYPGRTKQRIVGLRDQNSLPNRMHYHLDHLTVVQNEFADVIRLGDGDEVRSVVHPVAPGSEAVYDFRVADSLTLTLAGLPEPLKVYQVAVRPKDPDRPAVVGSVYLDRETADIVRMDFTFTPASYVDRRLDYIRISLENGLWQGHYWLPYEQRAELRRQVPELDFPAGAVIRARMRVGNYQFNDSLPPSFFRGPRVIAVPESERKAFPFDESLYSQLDEEGLDPEPDLEKLAAEAKELLRRRYLSGLPRLRLSVDGASSLFRFNRVEAGFLGAGVSYGLTNRSRARLVGGWSEGLEAGEVTGSIEVPLAGGRLEASAFYNRPADLEPTSVAGAINTLSALSAAAGADFGFDYVDLRFERGAAVGWDRPLGGSGWTATLEARAARQVAAADLAEGFRPDPTDELNRPLIPIDEGTLTEGRLSLRRDTPGPLGLTGALEVGGGALDSLGFARFGLDAARKFGSAGSAWSGRLDLRAGALLGEPPLQRLFYAGGRGTLPGYDYRAFAGDRFAVLDGVASTALVEPWLRLRLLGAVGGVSLLERRPPLDFGRAGTGEVKASLGAGLGVVHDILHLDVYRGVSGGGRWQVLLSANASLRDFL